MFSIYSLQFYLCAFFHFFVVLFLYRIYCTFSDFSYNVCKCMSVTFFSSNYKDILQLQLFYDATKHVSQKRILFAILSSVRCWFCICFIYIMCAVMCCAVLCCEWKIFNLFPYMYTNSHYEHKVQLFIHFSTLNEILFIFPSFFHFFIQILNLFFFLFPQKKNNFHFKNFYGFFSKILQTLNIFLHLVFFLSRKKK